MAGKRKQNTNGFHQQQQQQQQQQPQQANNDINSDETSTPIAFESPLQLFGEAKDKINGLFQKLENNVGRVTQFYADRELDEEVIKNVDNHRLSQLNKSIETIRNVLSRNQMKVAFFGRTSNGKSTVINAILHEKVLPMGYGHTTGCFLQIQGSQENEAYLEVQKKGQENERRPIQSVASIANALDTGALKSSTLVKIYWPITKCPLLKYDVVLVDSPGVDVEKNLDHWIDEHCHDADVFVLVSNAESTLNNTEKEFFHRVSEKLSKPNIFILNNRWDNIADDPDSMEQVKGQHFERAINFLSDELKISSKEEAKQRTFFVSARETLQARSPNSFSFPVSDNERRRGYSDRCDEFRNFERRFEESLSRSAVQTKFKQHTDKGKETIQELDIILDTTRSLVEHVSKRKQSEFNNCLERCKSIHNLFYNNEAGLQDQIVEIKKRIQIMSDTEFDNEVRRLSRIVEDYSHEFSPAPEKLVYYKEQLYLHVEQYLSENLKTRISNVITKKVNPFNKVMCDIGKLLAEERQRKIEHTVESQNYVQDDLFDLRIYKQFYTEFQEDLEFRFSLGLVSIIRKFQSKFSVAKPISTTNAALDHSHSHLNNHGATMSVNTDFLSIMERFMMNPPQSPTTVGSLAVGGILVRTVGWKVIIATTVVYGALYAYEYLTWTNSAKERTFKAQYVKYACKGLQDCVPIISQHIANSVEQKMVSTFAHVKKEVDIEDSELKNRVGLLKGSLEKLKKCEDFTCELLGENNILMNELVGFAMSFLTV